MLNYNDPNRTPDGKFKTGHGIKSGGRPKRVVERAYLDAITGAVSEDDMAEITKQAVKDAKAGDSTARAWLADRTVGKPVQGIELRVDEAQIVGQLRLLAEERGLSLIELGNLLIENLGPGQMDAGDE